MAVASRLKIRPFRAECYDDLDVRDIAEIGLYIEAESLMASDRAGQRRNTGVDDGAIPLAEAMEQGLFD